MESSIPLSSSCFQCSTSSGVCLLTTCTLFALVLQSGSRLCGLMRHRHGPRGISAVAPPRLRGPFARRSHPGPSRASRGPSRRNSTGKVSPPSTSSLPCGSPPPPIYVIIFIFFVPLAIELRNWLLFFAPVVLEGFLPSLYFQNLILLVEVLHLLLSRKISVKALDAAEHNLKIFLKSFEDLYGDFFFFFFLSSSFLTSHFFH